MPISDHYRQHKLYNKELYADFIAAQIKTLSFLAYIIRLYQVFWLWVLIDLRLKSIDIDFSLCDYWIVVCVHTWSGSGWEVFSADGERDAAAAV